MGILLIILGVIGWIVSVNSWFIVPTALYLGCMIVGAIIVFIQVAVYLKTSRTIRKSFDMFK